MKRRRPKQFAKFYWYWGVIDHWPAWARSIARPMRVHGSGKKSKSID